MGIIGIFSAVDIGLFPLMIFRHYDTNVTKRIAFLISAPFGGGAERSMRMIHRQLRQMNQNSVLISINRTNLRSDVEAEGEINLGRSHRAGLIETIWTILKFNFYLASLRPSVIVLNCEIAELLGVFCVFPDVRLFVVEHANPSWRGRQRLGIFTRRLLITRGAKFVAVSNHIRPPFPLHDYIRIIPNPIDSNCDSKRHETSDEIRRIVYIGRLTRIYKNPALIVNLSRKTDIPAVFFGVGEMLEELKGLVDRLGVCAEFPGWVENPWAKIGPHDLIVVPSENEGDGLVVVEAILRQVPLLLSDIPDFRRFNLADPSYCASLEDFASRVSKYRNSLSKLRPSLDAKNSTINSRSLDLIVDSWLEVLGFASNEPSNNHTN